MAYFPLMYVTTYNDDINDDDDDCDDDRLWWKMWKKIGIEHSRTDMTDRCNKQVRETCNEILQFLFIQMKWEDK